MYKNVQNVITNRQRRIVNQQLDGVNVQYQIISDIFQVTLFIDGNQFNHSNNPTFKYNDTIGYIVRDNKPYFTGIGLYNQQGQLLVMCKTVIPIQLKYPIFIQFKITKSKKFYNNVSLLYGKSGPLHLEGQAFDSQIKLFWQRPQDGKIFQIDGYNLYRKEQ